MPIQSIWNDKDSDEIHVVAGHSSAELWSSHAVVEDLAGNAHWVEQYQAHHADVRFRFIPRFTGTVTGHTHSGFGVRVNLVTGQVHVDATLPTPVVLRNFILDLEAAHQPNGAVLRYRFRVHVHQAYASIRLTPSRLSFRRRAATGAEDLQARFSLHATFTDGVVGDVTNNPEVRWGTPASNPRNVNDDGELRLASSDAAGADIDIEAHIRYDPTNLRSHATLHVDEPWSSAPPIVAQLIPGSIRVPSPGVAIEIPSTAVVPADHVPNILFIGDGFTDTEAPMFRSFVIDLVHHVRQNPVNFPWNLLRGSMNFWSVHVPSPAYGVSIGAEVLSRTAGGSLLARIIPVPQPPPSPLPRGTFWDLDHLLFQVGLPVPGDATRSPADLIAEWTTLLGQDPGPLLGATQADIDRTIERWKIAASRGLVDEVDTPLGSVCGLLSLEDPTLFDLSPRRGGRARMDPLLRAIVADLPDATGTVAQRPLGHLWARRADGTTPPDHDLVCIVTPSRGREQNGDGYFFVNMFDGGEFDLVDVSRPGPPDRYEVAPPPPVDRDDADGTHGSVLVHELSHSFNLNDEYGELTGPPTAALSGDSNTMLESDAQRGAAGARTLDGDRIKWRWHRIEASGVLSAAPTFAGAELTVTLRDLESIVFNVNDVVHLRHRNGRAPLPAIPVISEQLIVTHVDPATDQVRLRASGTAINYPALVPINTAATRFGIGTLLYRPKPAPASVLDPVNHPYAELVAHNIRSYITRNNRPLVDFPAAAALPAVSGTDEQIPLFVPDADPTLLNLRAGFPAASLVRIVGLYPNGELFHLGVFHATGHCVMRSASDVPQREFCAVCRYILTETIDPSLHDLVDREYDRIYPLA